MRTSSTSARYPLCLRHARIFLWMDATPWPSNSGCFSLKCRDISLKVRELLVTRSAGPKPLKFATLSPIVVAYWPPPSR